jgi:hypothetical protein
MTAEQNDSFSTRVDVDFGFGKGLSEHGYSCCGKPKGCTNMNPGCAHLNHPYKQWVREHTLEDR